MPEAINPWESGGEGGPQFLKVAEAGADKVPMAALPFARHIKRKTETETETPRACR